MQQQTTITTIRGKYTSFAVFVLNTIVMLVALNSFFFAAFSIKDRLSDGSAAAAVPITQHGDLFNSDGSPQVNARRNPYQLEWIDFNAYGNTAAEYVSHVLDDFDALSKLGFVYQPWVEFSEPPYHGRLVNVDVDPRGFPSRRTLNPPNPKNLPIVNVFALGGSTTFGYNVSDEHTWPSYLATVLNDKARTEGIPIHVQVANYGRGYFNPSQESILVTDLLKSGYRPSLVIFMDGVNPGYEEDTPRFSQVISERVKDLQFAADEPLMQTLGWLPMARFAALVKRRLTRVPIAAGNAPNPRRVDQIVNSFEQNLSIASAICKLYNAEAVFFLQPNAIYNYRLELFRRPVPESFLDDRKTTSAFYDRLRSQTQRIFLGDMFQSWGASRKAIVDEVHYR